MINYCVDVKCMNNAVCRPLFLNYSCECLTSSYSGRHCEIVSTGLIVRQTVSKSVGYVAIIFLVAVVSFIVIMDLLKYGFGIGSNKEQLARNRKAKSAKRIQRVPVIIRFVYVNKPPEESPQANDRKHDSNIEETKV